MTAEELKTLRKSVKLTQKQLAEALGVTPTTVARWERGKRGTPEEDRDGRTISAPHAKLIQIVCAQAKKDSIPP